MIYGVLRVDIRILGSNSLKDKRSVVRKQIEKVRHAFQISANEVGDHDLLGNAVIGFTMAGSNKIEIEKVLNHVLRMIDENPEVQVYDSVILIDKLK